MLHNYMTPLSLLFKDVIKQRDFEDNAYFNWDFREQSR